MASSERRSRSDGLRKTFCVFRTSKTISLREDAYNRLKAQKRDDESFTEVVLRMTAEDPRDFSNLVGADLNVSWDTIKSARERSEANERREELLRERVQTGE